MKKFLAVMAVLVIGMVAAGFGMGADAQPMRVHVGGSEPEAGLGWLVSVAMGLVIGLVSVALLIIDVKRRKLDRLLAEREARAERPQAVMPVRRVDPVERLVEVMTLEVMGRMGTDHERHEKHERIDAPGEMARLDEEVWHG